MIDRSIEGDGGPAGAFSAIERAIEDHPGDPRFIARLIRCIKMQIETLSKGDGDDTIEMLLKRVSRYRSDFSSQHYFTIIGKLLAKNRYQAAEMILSLAWKQFPAAPEVLHARAMLAHRQERFDEAEALWRKLETSAPDRWRVAVTHRARIFARQGRQKEAAKLFEALLDRHPDFGEAAKFLVRHYLEIDDVKAAERIVAVVSEHIPDSHIAISCKTRFAIAVGDVARAAADLEHAVERWPDQSELHLLLIDLHCNCADTEKALRRIDDALTRFPKDVRLLDRKLALYSDSAGPLAQIDVIDTFLEADPERIELHLRKARLLGATGARLEQAEACARGLRVDPRNVELWRIQIRCYLNANLDKMAYEALDRALLEFDGNDIVAGIARAELLFACEQYDRAGAAAKAVLDVDPLHADALIWRARAFEMDGDWQSALEYYCRAADISEDRRAFAAEMSRMALAINFCRAADAAKAGTSPAYPAALFQAALSGTPTVPYLPNATVMHVTSQLGPGGAERQLTVTAIEQSRRDGGLTPIAAVWSLNSDLGRDHFRSRLEEANIVPIHLEERFEGGAVRNFLATHIDDREALAFLGTLPSDVVRLAAQLYCEIRLHRPTVLHLWQDTTCAVGGIAGYLAGVPRIILSTRSTRPVERQRARPYLQNAFRQLLALNNVTMLSNSANGARDYADWLGHDLYDIRTVVNGYNFARMRERVAIAEVDAIRAELDANESDILLGGVMRLQSEKRPDLWVESAIAFVSNNPKAKAVLVGAGKMESILRERIAQEGLSRRIWLVGSKSPIEPWMAAMDVLLLTSVTEGLPNVLIEAQALGTPVVTTNVGGAAETLIDGKTGIVVPAGATGRDIGNLLAVICSNPTRLESMGKAGIGWTAETFSIEKTIDQLSEIYREKLSPTD